MCDFQRALFLLDFTCPEKKSYKANLRLFLIKSFRLLRYTITSQNPGRPRRSVQCGRESRKKESIPSPPPAPDESPRMISELVAFFYFV